MDFGCESSMRKQDMSLFKQGFWCQQNHLAIYTLLWHPRACNEYIEITGILACLHTVVSKQTAHRQ